MRVAKAYKGIALEGMLATWYARNTAKLTADFKACAQRIAARLPRRARVLEVAPGPGYLAIELARLGPYQVTGLDISRSFVRMATVYAQQAGVDVEFRQGDAAALPFADDSFDFVVCRAAFKNFSNPVGALAEMYRVLRPGGEALIVDMRNDTHAAQARLFHSGYSGHRCGDAIPHGRNRNCTNWARCLAKKTICRSKMEAMMSEHKNEGAWIWKLTACPVTSGRLRRMRCAARLELLERG
jgi:ubiquinone/menaquinone biosynthesis C-methylase UbiE